MTGRDGRGEPGVADEERSRDGLMGNMIPRVIVAGGGSESTPVLVPGDPDALDLESRPARAGLGDANGPVMCLRDLFDDR